MCIRDSDKCLADKDESQLTDDERKYLKRKKEKKSYTLNVRFTESEDVYKRQLLYSLSRVVRPAELHSRSAEENCSTEHVSSLRSVKVATLPCDACASIPCGLAVRKQH